jgi:perosamine synthetase
MAVEIPAASIASDSFIPVNSIVLNGNERRYIEECLETGWISSEGPFIERFERAFAAVTGRRHAIAVTNGSAALDTVIVALNLGFGNEVILPTFTIISCAAAVVRAGAIPVVVDCDPDTWNMDVARIEEAITPRTRAIMVVHIYGLPTDMESVLRIAERYGLMVIEDAAEAHGLTFNGQPCGSFGEVSTFSFYPNKLVTTGEGGMIVTDSDTVAARCRSLRNLCFQPGRRFVHEELGWNLRMTNLQAAIGLAQVERLEDHVRIKRTIGTLYDHALREIRGLQLPVPAINQSENLYWVYGVVLNENFPFDAAEAMSRLAAKGIGTRPFFWPIHEQPVFRHMGLFEGITCPVAERIARRGFYLPSGIGLTVDQINRVAEAVKEILE